MSAAVYGAMFLHYFRKTPDGRVVSYVTSAAYGYSVGRGVVYGYLPADLAVEGTSVEVEYFGDRHAATVSAEPLWDPKGERLRA